MKFAGKQMDYLLLKNTKKKINLCNSFVSHRNKIYGGENVTLRYTF